MDSPRILAGRYEVGELIGRGGMADVLLGRDIRLGRSVAIKQLRADLARDPMLQSRFRREAQAVAGLNHPSIVAVYDTGDMDLPGGAAHDVKVPFIVMEYVQGRTLREFIKGHELGIDDSVGYMLGILAALEYSHRSGIVHRDIKPANVMVTPDGSVKVMDFGIARALADSAATMTQTQAVLGTAQYLSPEQARGETVDARSDLYSAGCLLYEMLAGRPPFIGDSPVSVAYQHVRELPEPASRFNPEVTPALDSVLEHALQKDKADRFQTAAAFAEALRAALNGVLHQAAGAATEAFPAQAPATELITQQAQAVSEQTSALSPTDYTPGDDDGPHTASYDREQMPAALAVGNEYDIEPERRAKRRAWTVTLLIALLLVLVGGGYYLYNVLVQNAAPETVAVPAVAGLDENAATNAIWEGDLRPRVELEYSNDVEKGMVTRTDPGVGEQVEPGSQVLVYISQGNEFTTIPDNLTGRTEAEVRDKLRQLGLEPGDSEPANSATLPRGNVVTTKPAPGKKVKTGSNVDLIVSNGLVSVPNMVDETVEDAGAMLDDAAVALPYRVEEVENEVVKAGTVVGQSVKAGTNVEQGTEIILTVAIEPASPEPETDRGSDEGNNRGNDGDGNSGDGNNSDNGNGRGTD
ncbi:Stk1 family PASTA domain-containing Ser/Thr kinase [Arthrobacter sulfonylureivorans]|uniref:non-specific serine/threonine protein kinase n=1 Tax=Arthrobacter sulfonylureivorans TaxID=2486855 RepID=A0ABY3WCA8_9MICC|nr:Stk1 family PASTA domain-containing Ser/Thr kinase [Arthrobacter sulfonylureivorans]UNK45976.1 Stk1 family PASTA domain-containing Ser/Thr kinase [Arthrobacter sulfonylureivorans]